LISIGGIGVRKFISYYKYACFRIKGTYGKLELPCYSEGFNKLYYVSLNDDGFVLKEWKHEV
jgi:hypothetical protein